MSDSDHSTGDIDRIYDEMGDHGDTRTVHPRLVCESCHCFVYLCRPRDFEETAVRAECDCSSGDPTRDKIPDRWTEIQQFVDTGTDRNGGQADE